MRIVPLALLLAAVSALRAQGQQQTLQGLPEYGVLLTGTPEVPMIVNHSGRAIIAFSMNTYTTDGGKGGAGFPLVYLRSAAIADGAQYQPLGATRQGWAGRRKGGVAGRVTHRHRILT